MWCCPTIPPASIHFGFRQIPLKIPLVLKPGSAEPWSPYRIIQAFIRAGAPREAFSFYPTDHAGSGEDPAAVSTRNRFRRRRVDQSLE